MKRRIPVTFFVLLLQPGVSRTAAQHNQEPPAPQEKARVFITDSQSWEISGGNGGTSGGFGGAVQGGARPQTAEIVKTFGERCPRVITNNIQSHADYIVVLDHEGGKGLLRHRNKVAVFNRLSGDSVVSKSTLSLGGSVQTACEAIEKDWSVNSAAIRSADLVAQSKIAASQSPASLEPAKTAAAAKLVVTSIPDGADIEVDGSFVGDTPSDIDVAAGEHTVAVKKSGFQTWERKLKISNGSSVHLKAELQQLAN